MPHNHTRLWVGLAIIAVTIPAVGTFYIHPAATSDLVGNPISAAGRTDLASRQQDSFGSGRIALREPLRDYQAEVNAALARQGLYPSQRFDGDSTYDDVFDDDPLDPSTDAFGNVSTRDVPNAPNVLAYSTDGPVTAEVSATNANGTAPGPATDGQASTAPSMEGNGAAANASTTTQDAYADAANADYNQPGTMSDTDVYRLVVNNLSPEHRDDFSRAYAAMSEEQRAGLLDSFRQQIQGGGQ